MASDKDVIYLCNAAVDTNQFELSPPCLPVEHIPAFRQAQRRIYLRATLTNDQPWAPGPAQRSWLLYVTPWPSSRSTQREQSSSST